MERTTVHLMRHGEVHNPAGVLYGRLPGFDLSPLGQAMARRVAQVLHDGGHDIRAVVASPLERAQQSAAPTADAYGLEVRRDDNLIEAANHFEGQAVNADRALLAHPRHWRYYLNPLRPSWGEAYESQVARMRLAIVAALRVAEGGEALLVSHQLPIWCMRLFLERRPLAHDPRRRQCALASLTSLTFEGRRLVGLSYWEPAGELLRGSRDMVPGTTAARMNEGLQDDLREAVGP